MSPAQREGARVRGRLAEMQDSAQARLAQIETELQDLGHAEARAKAAGGRGQNADLRECFLAFLLASSHASGPESAGLCTSLVVM